MPDLSQTVDLLSVLADPTRVRLLSLLEDVELSVAELTTITDLPQSRVSTHLRKLKDASLVRDRPDGGCRFYGFDDAMDKPARELWKLLHQRLDDDQLAQDRRRRDAALAARESRLPWPDEVAGQMERHYSPGRTWEATEAAAALVEVAGSLSPAGGCVRSAGPLPAASSITARPLDCGRISLLTDVSSRKKKT
jgi:ArsR family transcriptional regulator